MSGRFNINAARLLTFLCCSLPLAAEAVRSRWVLTQENEALFSKVLAVAQTGGFGPDVTNANITIGGDNVRVELVLVLGARQGFTLRHPPLDGAVPHPVFFAVTKDPIVATDAGTSANVGPEGETVPSVDHSERLVTLLDEIFPADPWVEPVDWFSHDGSAKDTGAWNPWKRDGFRGLFGYIARRFVSHVGRRFTVGLLVLLIAAIGYGMTMLWRAKPDPRV